MLENEERQKGGPGSEEKEDVEEDLKLRLRKYSVLPWHVLKYGAPPHPQALALSTLNRPQPLCEKGARVCQTDGNQQTWRKAGAESTGHRV